MNAQKNAKNKIFLLLLRFCLLFSLCLTAVFATGCKKKDDLTQYVSEYRNNLFLYVGEDFDVRAQNVVKEYPYVADGYKGELTKRVELTITAPQGVSACQVRFFANGTEHRGDASYDNVKRHFYYSCTADLADEYSLPLSVTFDGEEKEITLSSVKTERLLSLPDVLTHAFESERELLKQLTPNKEFEGELYVRLLYEETPFFYVGIVDRKGNVTALLMDGETGKILAKRTT